MDQLETISIEPTVMILQLIGFIHLLLAVSLSFKAVKTLRDVELAVGLCLAWFIPIVGSLIVFRLIKNRSGNKAD